VVHLHQARQNDWSLIGGNHHGQASVSLRQQAGHMSAIANFCHSSKSACQAGPSTCVPILIGGLDASEWHGEAERMFAVELYAGIRRAGHADSPGRRRRPCCTARPADIRSIHSVEIYRQLLRLRGAVAAGWRSPELQRLTGHGAEAPVASAELGARRALKHPQELSVDAGARSRGLILELGSG
jgi:hypothetical protein